MERECHKPYPTWSVAKKKRHLPLLNSFLSRSKYRDEIFLQRYFVVLNEKSPPCSAFTQATMTVTRDLLALIHSHQSRIDLLAAALFHPIAASLHILGTEVSIEDLRSFHTNPTILFFSN